MSDLIFVQALVENSFDANAFRTVNLDIILSKYAQVLLFCRHKPHTGLFGFCKVRISGLCKPRRSSCSISSTSLSVLATPVLLLLLYEFYEYSVIVQVLTRQFTTGSRTRDLLITSPTP